MLEDAGGWYKVRLKSGKIGFISKKLVRLKQTQHLKASSPTSQKDNIAKKTFSSSNLVMSTAMWSELGIVVKKGEQVTITAQGNIVFDPGLPPVGPDGGWRKAQTLSQPNKFPLHTAMVGALVARIGDGPAFFVGQSKQFIANESGGLYFAINDRDNSLHDNSGAFNISVEIKSGKTYKDSSSTNKASTLKLKRSWSGKNEKENIIALTYRNIKQKDDKISADVTLINSTGTWVFTKQGLTPDNIAKYPLSGKDYTLLIGPFGSKKLGNVEFGSGHFLHLDAVSPTGSLSNSSSAHFALLSATAIDLMMRGLFKKELPANAFDIPVVIGMETGLASIDPLFKTIESNCSASLGILGNALIKKDTEGALGAIGDFALCTKKVKKHMTKFLAKYFTKEASKKFTEWASKNVVDFLDAPTRGTLIGLLTKSTFTAPAESWVKIAAVELKRQNKYADADIPLPTE